ncbi:MAG: rhamnogalacturonan acetylesterase, partial [Blastocatellia bacterium]
MHRSKANYILQLMLLCVGLSVAATAQTSWRFDFGPGKVAPGYTQVLPETIYSREQGFGFEPGAILKGSAHKDDALRGDNISSAQAFYFSVALPEGNYRVTPTLGDAAETSGTTVKAELRRLM